MTKIDDQERKGNLIFQFGNDGKTNSNTIQKVSTIPRATKSSDKATGFYTLVRITRTCVGKDSFKIEWCLIHPPGCTTHDQKKPMGVEII